jgi:hypothetical protein
MRAAAHALPFVAVGALLALAWAGHQQASHDDFITEKAEDDQYRVVVTMPDGKPAGGAEVCLDYEAGWDYSPARFRTGADGKVSIPHRYAEEAGWEWLWVSHQEGGRRYWHGRIYRRAVRWPRKVRLVADEP